MFTRTTVIFAVLSLLALMVWTAASFGQQSQPAATSGGYESTITTPAAPAATSQQPAQGAGNAGSAGAVQTKNYDESPESTLQLLKDSDAAMKSAASAGKGVHIVERSFFANKGESTLFSSEGDVMLPDRVKLTAELRLPKRLQPLGWDQGPIVIDAIAIGDVLYLKPSFSSKWTVFHESDSDELISDVDLESIHFYDYLSSSANLGQETLPDGTRAYHVHVTIDTPRLLEKLKSLIDPSKVQKYGSEFDKLKTSAIVEDVWVGADDLLVHQAVYSLNNNDLQLEADDSFNLTKWGEVVDIQAPALDVQTSAANTRSSCTCQSS